MKKTVIGFVAVILIAGCAGAVSMPSENESKAPVIDIPERVECAVYISNECEALTASFDNRKGTVEVKLSDRRAVTLPCTVSASGARYSNGHETFWEHHGEGSYWVGDELVFRGKVRHRTHDAAAER